MIFVAAKYVSNVFLVCYPYWSLAILQLVVKNELHVPQCLFVALCTHHYYCILPAREYKACCNVLEGRVALASPNLRCKGFINTIHICASLLSAVR